MIRKTLPPLALLIACGGGPQLTNLRCRDAAHCQDVEDPLKVLLAVDFADETGTLDKGVLNFRLGGNTQQTVSLSDIFAAQGIAEGTRKGTLKIDDDFTLDRMSQGGRSRPRLQRAEHHLHLAHRRALMTDKPDSPDDLPPEEAKKLSGLVPDIVRRALLTGVGALFMTEEGIRNAVTEMKLPKDALAFLLSQADKSRAEVARVVTQEVRRFLESDTLRRELWKLLTSVTLEVNASIQLKPPGEPGIRAKVRAKKKEPAGGGTAGAPPPGRQPRDLILLVDLTSALPGDIVEVDVVVRRGDHALARHDVQYGKTGAPGQVEMLVHASPGDAEVETTLVYAGKPARKWVAPVKLNENTPARIRAQ